MNHMEISQAGRDAWLGQSHGYRIAGDWACLNAELGLSSSEALAQQWALQLWACDKPYQGGALQGVKIAEATLEVQSTQPQHLYAETFARLPAGDREYSMVLVLASRSQGAEQVHDFANYPAPEHFVVPVLRGELNHTRQGDQLELRAERIENPRSLENLSGTLALELWALDQPYRGEQFTGSALGGVELGQLAGQASLQDVSLRVDASSLAGKGNLTVMLREWTASGYVTRDCRVLQLLAAEKSEPVSVQSAPVEERSAAPEVVSEQSAPVEERAAAPEVVSEQSAPVEERTAAAEVASVQSAPVEERSAASGLVSVQSASVEQLAAVPGLTRKIAQEIVKGRPFGSLDELIRVRGIGEKTLRKLRGLLTV